MKKEWKKPIATIVTKSTAEENVLVGCKNPTQPSGGSGPYGASQCVEIVTVPGGAHIDYCATPIIS